MPCTQHDDQQDQQNRQPFRSPFSRTLRLSERQNLQSFSLSHPSNQLPRINPSLSTSIHPGHLTEQISISVQESHIAGREAYANELGGNISDVLDSFDDNNVQLPSYSNQEYIDSGVVTGNNSVVAIDNQSPTPSSSSSQLNIYAGQSSNFSSYPSNSRVIVRDYENHYKQDSASTSSSTSSEKATTIHSGDHATPSSACTNYGIQTTHSINASDRRQIRTSKKNSKSIQLYNSSRESEKSRLQQNCIDEKALDATTDGFEENGKLNTYGIIPLYSNHRQVGVITNYLYDGSRFKGFQKSRKESYEVQVEIKHVDYENSYLCGYLCINHLTKSHPSITTFFDGEIISEDYPFLTKRWQATRDIDRAHWSKFQGFDERWSETFNLDSFDYEELKNSDYIYMRWKEHFLVPDHRIKQVEGASYEGFYYICYSKRTACIKGFYFHSNSENFESFQSLNLELDPQGSSQVYVFR